MKTGQPCSGSFLLNAGQLGIQSGFNALGAAFAAGHSADQRAIDSQLARDPAVQSAVTPVSLQRTMCGSIALCHEW